MEASSLTHDNLGVGVAVLLLPLFHMLYTYTHVLWLQLVLVLAVFHMLYTYTHVLRVAVSASVSSLPYAYHLH
eukprot:1058045-Amorphochlora_amoeboformis.AAC.1